MSITHLTFLDIETIPDVDKSHELFEKRFKHEIKNIIDLNVYPPKDVPQMMWDEKAGLHAEFGKIVCISIGKMVSEKVEGSDKPIEKFYIRTIASKDEKELLLQATTSIMKAAGEDGHLVAHNGLEFDFPFLMRRYMINGLPIPKQLRVDGVKLWDLKLKDTMKMWSGSAWNYKVSLELLCHILNIPSPKTGISGEDVAKLYFGEEDGLKRIGEYCAGDTLACAQIYCRMKGLPLIETIEYV